MLAGGPHPSRNRDKGTPPTPHGPVCARAARLHWSCLGYADLRIAGVSPGPRRSSLEGPLEMAAQW